MSLELAHAAGCAAFRAKADPDNKPFPDEWCDCALGEARKLKQRAEAFPALLAVAKAAWPHRGSIECAIALDRLDRTHPGWREWSA